MAAARQDLPALRRPGTWRRDRPKPGVLCFGIGGSGRIRGAGEAGCSGGWWWNCPAPPAPSRCMRCTAAAAPRCSAATLGLTLAEAKAVLAGLQRHLVPAQTEEHCQTRRRCARCGGQRPVTDRRPRRLISLFGTVAVRTPRLAAGCLPGRRSAGGRYHPAAHLAGWRPAGARGDCTVDCLWSGACGGSPRCGACYRARRDTRHRGHSPERRCRRSRSLGEAACVGPTCHVLDWLHLAMRIHHVAQAVKRWPGVAADDRQDGARLADAVQHIRWRLWHGQVRRARDLIGDTLVVLGAMAVASSAAAPSALRTDRCRPIDPQAASTGFTANPARSMSDASSSGRRHAPYKEASRRAGCRTPARPVR